MLKKKELVFIQEKNYQGTETCGNGNVNWVGDAVNDKFQSLKIPEDNAAVVVFLHGGFRGTARVATQHVPDLSTLGLNLAISSYIVLPTACFYTAKNFGGQFYCYGEGQTNLLTVARALNDKFQSVKIPSNLQVTVFQHGGYNGIGALLTGDIDDLSKKGVGSMISAFIVSSRPAQ